MKIVADENLAFTDYFFADVAEIDHRAGRTLSSSDIENADALLIRSVTRVDAQLLYKSALKFIGSATIGTDHLDIPTIEKEGITWSNATGCNAQAVAEYVITALMYVRPNLLEEEQPFTLGIVGLGNVGSRLAYMAKLLGWNVIGYDPFMKSPQVNQVGFEELLEQSDVISIHVPLTHTGHYPTYHLFNREAFANMKQNAILVNSARGPVVEEEALKADIQTTQRDVILDVFEHEPEISEELLNLVRVVTPHIAGYSLEGKARGTQMIYDDFCQRFGLEANKRFETQLPLCESYFSSDTLKQVLQKHLRDIYDIARDDHNLRACLENGKVNQSAFDHLRKTYPLRREWAAHGGPKA